VRSLCQENFGVSVPLARRRRRALGVSGRNAACLGDGAHELFDEGVSRSGLRTSSDTHDDEVGSRGKPGCHLVHKSRRRWR